MSNIAAPPPLRTPRVAIIGAGMSGIGMACKLQQAGIASFELFEQWSDFGGTWHANTYPGLSCDVPSRYYQYTFAPNPDWGSVLSPGAEISAYLHRVADQHGLRAKTSFSTPVADAEWTGGEWLLRTQAGREARFDFLITATGGLVRTRKPAIPGLEDFAGACFHSAEWEHDVPLDGRRIGVIGTGSTGMQITRDLAPRASHFSLFQRTPQWILPLPNFRYHGWSKAVYRRFPTLQRPAYDFWRVAFEASFGRGTVKPGLVRRAIQAACRVHLRVAVKDSALRERFRPDFVPMCKRLVMGTGFYKRFERETVELVDTAIDHVEAAGVVTVDGVLHPLDVLVLATGFDAHAFVQPMELTGPGGVRLSEVWDEEPFGYRTVGLPGFPNVLMLIGPHSPFGNQSLFAISETQQDFAMDAIGRWRRGELDTLSPTQAATERFMADVRAAVPDTVWASGCDSWYLGKDGLPHAWPWLPGRHRELLAQLEEADWELHRDEPPVAA